ncbi:MAG: YlmH/Sll1252 family protein [Clostridia bacterium]|nr:YlmH/Sll1252 family protein [Clostridia bacterium]
MGEKRLFIEKIEDKYEKFLKDDYLISSDYLSLNEQSDLKGFLRGKPAILFGGYPEAERKEVHFIPEYMDITSEKDLIQYYTEYPDLCSSDVIIVSIPKTETRTLSHRDYLGAILGEGIVREKVGDILVEEKCAKVIISKDVSEYILENLKYVGRVSVKAEKGTLSDLKDIEDRKEELRLNVPSVRLDNVISEIFRLSRNDAKNAIEKGIVFVDGAVKDKPDYYLKGGEKLVLRGKGKAYFNGIVGESRKGNLYISVTRFV